MNITNKYTVIICLRIRISLANMLNSCINIHHYSIFPLNFRGQTGVTAISQAKENSRKTKVLRDKMVAEMGFEPHDLRVMSPTSYQAAPLRDMVPETGLEPVRDFRLTGF